VGLGFSQGNDNASNYERMKNKVHDELKKHFRPEFLNRIDDIVVFRQLEQQEIVQMVDLMIARVETQLANKDMALELTPNAKLLLANRGFDPVLGARPLRRTIQREIEDKLSEKILFGEIQAGQIVVVDVEGYDPDSPSAQDEAVFTFRGEPKPVTVPDVPPVDMAKSDE
jgi:ATP-dependent Clp protease ATP-binding subunit ClpC